MNTPKEISMRIVSINGHVIDLNEVISKDAGNTAVSLTFKNGDHIVLPWRDHQERSDILHALELSN